MIFHKFSKYFCLKHFAHIGYKGYNYRGWQRQPTALSIQEVMEDKLSRILHKKTICIGCGRTDAMVNASQFFFHFETANELQPELIFRLNKILPDDIAIFDIFPVSPDIHAQFSATSRTYDYIISTQKDPFLNELTSPYEFDFDIDAMNQATKLIPKYSDFINFCLTPRNYSTTLCKIMASNFYILPSRNLIRFQITSNRFLRGMVRVLVQRLIDVGNGTTSLNEFESILANSSIPKEMKPAHPQGLYLSQVTYPFLLPSSIISSTPFNFLLNNKEWIKL